MLTLTQGVLPKGNGEWRLTIFWL